MALTLALLPREVLAHVTGYLSLADVLAKLCTSGDRLLTLKLKTGGVTYLYVASSRVPESLIDSIHAFQLQSFRVSALWVPADALRSLIKGLPRNLDTLEIDSAYSRSLFVGDDLVLPPVHARHLTTCSTSVWMVGETFPRLRRFLLHGADRIFSGDPFLVSQIVGGFPATLEEVCPFSTELGIDRALPPNLTRISSLYAVPTALHAIHLESLTSLDLDISKVPADTVSRKTLESYGDRITGWEQPGYQQMLLPQSLTILRLKCAAVAFRGISSLPRGLHTLEVEAIHRPPLPGAEWHRPSQLLALIPPSVTNVVLSNMTFLNPSNEAWEQNNRAYTTSQKANVLDKVKRFTISYFGLHPTASSEKDTEFFEEFISIVPYAEYFDLKPQEKQPRLRLESLKLFKNPQNLRHLLAPLDPECLPFNYEGPYPLGVILPRLLHLTVWSERIAGSFNPEALPKTLREFNSDSSILASHLNLIPRSVASVRCDIAVEADDIDEIFAISTGEFIDPSTGALSPTATNDHCLMHTRLDLDNGQEVMLYRSKLDGSLILDWEDSSSVSRNGGVEHSYVGHSSLNWPSEMPSLPERLTELRISSALFSDALNLPLLVKLTVEGVLRPEIVFTGMPSLVDLMLEGWEQPIIHMVHLDCPPKLTRLTSTHQGWPFKSVPTSLTYINASDVFLDHIQGLTNLVSFHDTSAYHSLIEWTKALPSSITELSVLFDPKKLRPMDEQAQVFWQHFTSLSTLVVFGSQDYLTIDEFYQSLPDSLTSISGGSFNSQIRSLSLLARRAGFKHGEVVIQAGENITSLGFRMISRAYPRWFPHGQHTGAYIPLPNDFVDFLPYLSPSTQSLLLSHLNYITYAKDGIDWPSSLTSLHFTEATRAPTTFLHLPPNLTKLVVHWSFPDEHQALLKSLPASLTHLEVPNWAHANETSSWPPNLKFLSAALNAQEFIPMLKRLPQSLIQVEMSLGCLTKQEHFDALPSSLVYIKFQSIRLPDDIDALAMAQKRGVIWLVEPTLLPRLFPKTDFEGDLDALIATSQVRLSKQ